MYLQMVMNMLMKYSSRMHIIMTSIMRTTYKRQETESSGVLSSRTFLETGSISSTVPACWLWQQLRVPGLWGVQQQIPHGAPLASGAWGPHGGKAAAVQGCKYGVLLQDNTRRSLTHRVRDNRAELTHV